MFIAKDKFKKEKNFKQKKLAKRRKEEEKIFFIEEIKRILKKIKNEKNKNLPAITLPRLSTLTFGDQSLAMAVMNTT